MMSFGKEFEKQKINYEAGVEIRQYFTDCERIAVLAYNMIHRNPTTYEMFKYLEHQEKIKRKNRLAKFKSMRDT